MSRDVSTSPHSRRRVTSVTLAMLLALVSAYALPGAQAPAKKALTVDDYTKWRSITDSAISGDGKWATYTLQLTNTIPAEAKPVLHLRNLETNEDVTVQDATGGTFSADSKWIAYQVDPGAAERARRDRGPSSGSGSGGTTAPAVTPPADPAAPPSAPAPPPAIAPGTVPPATAPAAPATPPSAPAVTQAPSPAPAQPAAPGSQPAAPASAGQGPSTGSGQGPSTGSGQGRGSAASTIPPRRVELRNLADGTVRSWQDIGSFTFSPTSTHLILRRRAPDAAGGGGRGGATGGPGAGGPGGGGAAGGGRGSGDAPAGPRGLDVVLLDLRTGRHQLLGSVGDIAFNRTGSLLAYTVDAAVKDGNGLFVFDARTGRITPLDNDAKSYNRLAWNEDGTALAVLKGSDVEKMREKDNVLVAFPNVPERARRRGRRHAGDPRSGEGGRLPQRLGRQRPRGARVERRQQARVLRHQGAGPGARHAPRKTTDEAADVDVWNTADERIQSAQMIRAEQDRNFTFRQAFDVAAKRFVKLADETMRDLDVAPDGKWAVGRDTRGYVHDYKRPAADFYRVNTSTGERTLIMKGQLTGSHTFGITPHGRQFLYWKDNRFQAYDLDAGTTQDARRTARPPSFIDMEFDHPGPKPSYGIAGYTQRRQGGHRAAPLRPVAAAARRLRAEEPDERRRREGRHPLPSCVRTEPVDLDRSTRATGPRGTYRPLQAGHAVGLRRVDEEGGLLRAGGRAAEGARATRTRRSARR